MSTGLPSTTARGPRGQSSRAMAQAVLIHVCTRPGLDIPDAWIRGLVDAGEATWLVEAAERTMVAGLLWSALTASQRSLLPAECSRRLRDTHLGNALRWQAYRRLLVDCARKLAAENISVAALKGAALLERVYPDPGQRALADLDLLVPEHALEAAHSVLGRGAARVSHERVSTRHIGEIVMQGEGGRIELHGARTHAALWPQTGDLLDTGRTTSVDGAEVIMPGEVDLWLHLACHGLDHSPYTWPRAAADLARVQGLPQWSQQHWQTVWQAAERHGLGRKVLLAAAMAGGGKVPAGLLDAGAPPDFALAAEARASEAWGMGTTAEPVSMGPWARGWVAGHAGRGALLGAYVFRPGAHIIGNRDLPLWAAIVVYPGYVAHRSWQLLKTLLAWRRARRGRLVPGIVGADSEPLREELGLRSGVYRCPVGPRRTRRGTPRPGLETASGPSMSRTPPLPQVLAVLPAVILLLGRLRRVHGTSDMKGLVAAATPGPGARPLSGQRAEVALRVSRTLVRRMGRLFPQPCLYWSLAAYHFLTRAGETPVIHIGVRSQDGEMLSHAWVTVRGEPVAGQPDHSGFAEITSLP